MNDFDEVPEPLRGMVGPEVDRLLRTLSQKDDVILLLLRFHLATESLLERIIVARLPAGHQFLDNVSPTYHQKLELVNAFGVLESGVVGALRKLNKIRNASAHERDQAVGLAEIEQIGRPLGQTFAR